jgi:hypothetical protein
VTLHEVESTVEGDIDLLGVVGDLLLLLLIGCVTGPGRSVRHSCTHGSCAQAHPGAGRPSPALRRALKNPNAVKSHMAMTSRE